MNQADFRRYASDPMEFFADAVIPTADGPQRWGDCWFDFQREWLQELSAALLAIAKGEKADIRKLYFEGPKGIAKSTIIALATIWLLVFARQPLLVQIGAVDQDNAGESLKAARDVLHFNQWLDPYVSIQTWKALGKKTKSVAEWLAADIAGSPGARPSVLFIDEFCNIEKREFVENLLDNAGKIANAITVVFTNAGWKDSYQYKWRCDWLESPAWKCMGRYEPSPAMAPEDLAESERRNTRARHRRLQYTEWADESEDGIPPDLIDRAIVLPGAASGLPIGHISAIGGLDMGLRRDKAGFAITAIDTSRLKVACLTVKTWTPPRFGEIDIDTLEGEIIELAARFRLRCIMADPWNAAQLTQRLRKRGIPCRSIYPTNGNLDVMALAIHNGFREGIFDLYDHKELIRDLKRLSIVEKPGDKGFRLVSPRDASGHGDAATAFNLSATQNALWCESVRRDPSKLLDAESQITSMIRPLGNPEPCTDSPRPDMAVEFSRR